METGGSNLVVDPTEYHTVRWLTISEARKIITDPANIQALNALEHIN